MTPKTSRRPTSSKKTKDPNFSKYIYDKSPGCYLTNYMISALNFYYAIKYYLKYSTLADLTPEELENTEYVLNKQMLCHFFIFFNLFVGLSTISCGLVHNFFYDEKKITSTIFWSAGQCLIGLCVVFNGLFPLFCIYEITSVIHYRVILGIAFAIAISLGVEELVWEKITYGVMSLVGIGMAATMGLVVTCLPGLLLDSSFQFDEGLYYTGLAVFGGFVVWYLKIAENCRTPNAFSNNMCPFPDQFNHNAMLHVATAFCYWALNSSFMCCFS